MGLVESLRDKGEVVAAEGIRCLPFVAVFVAASDRDVVKCAFGTFVFPNGCFDSTELDAVDWLLGHFVLLRKGLRL